MPKKKYSYSKDDRPRRKIKPKFLIVTEGEREDAYFRFFEKQSYDCLIDVDIVPRDQNKSAPKHVQDRLEAYKENQKWLPDSEDQIWFVFDVDKWGKQIHELKDLCEMTRNWNIAISNPCFEVWLHNHNPSVVGGVETCEDLKRELHTQTLGHFKIEIYAPQIATAIVNSKAADTHPDHVFPGPLQTKVYKLAESLLAILNK